MKHDRTPAHPERTCWGCDKFCPADSLACGNGTVRTMHPVELFGDDWLECLGVADRDQDQDCSAAEAGASLNFSIR
jgi:hypothetical protein